MADLRGAIPPMPPLCRSSPHSSSSSRSPLTAASLRQYYVNYTVRSLLNLHGYRLPPALNSFPLPKSRISSKPVARCRKSDTILWTVSLMTMVCMPIARIYKRCWIINALLHLIYDDIWVMIGTLLVEQNYTSAFIVIIQISNLKSVWLFMKVKTQRVQEMRTFDILYFLGCC